MPQDLDPTLDQQNQNPDPEQQDPTDNGHVDNQQAPVQNEPDFRKLYVDSLQQYNNLQNQFQQIQQQLSGIQQQTPNKPVEYTDEDLARIGTVPVIKNVVAQVIREELGESLGGMKELSQNFKRTKQLEQSEAQFFQQFPHLAQYKDQLSSVTRQVIEQNRRDPSDYGQVALAAIGQMVAMNAFAAPQNPTPSAPVTPRSAPPTSPGRPPASNPAPRIGELERRGMRMIGLNPDDRKHVEEYLAMVNADEGITMER